MAKCVHGTEVGPSLECVCCLVDDIGLGPFAVFDDAQIQSLAGLFRRAKVERGHAVEEHLHSLLLMELNRRRANRAEARVAELEGSKPLPPAP